MQVMIQVRLKEKSWVCGIRHGKRYLSATENYYKSKGMNMKQVSRPSTAAV